MKKIDHETIQRVLDGDMTIEEFIALQQRMRREPELVNLYRDYALLHHTLSEEHEGGFPVSSAAGDRARRGIGVRVLMMIAAAIALLAAGWWIRSRFPVSDAEVATTTFSLDAVWRFEGPTRNLGGATGVSAGSRLLLEQGRAAISLEPSVTAVIEGPAEVAFADLALNLSAGSGWFHCSGSGGPLRIGTPRFSVVDEGTEFAIEVPPSGSDAIHVFDGRIKASVNDGGETSWITSGEMATIGWGGRIKRSAPSGRTFPQSLGRFRTILPDEIAKADWQIAYGSPTFDSGRLEGANFSAFHQLETAEPSANHGVLLVTIDVGKPATSAFHTDGWAGMSFFNGDAEVLFFGDSFGGKSSWSLDVKQRIPLVFPEKPVVGPKVVTLRYDKRTGEVSLHEGGVPLRPAFCRGALPAGTTFDRFRIGASAGAALAVKSLVVRSGG
jgi:hypothetical protein